MTATPPDRPTRHRRGVLLLAVAAVHGLLLWAMLQAGGGMQDARQAAPPSHGVLMLWRPQAVPAAERVEPAAPRGAARAPAAERGSQSAPDVPQVPRAPFSPSALPAPPAPPASPLEAAGPPAATAPPVLASAGPAVDPVAASALSGTPPPASTPSPASSSDAALTAAVVMARADHRHCPNAPYPAALQQRGIEGAALVRVRVDSEGRAAEVRLLAGSGWRLFDDAALQRARGCRFFPALRSGAPVESWVEFPVRFALAG
jgi:protein TonB